MARIGAVVLVLGLLVCIGTSSVANMYVNYTGTVGGAYPTITSDNDRPATTATANDDTVITETDECTLEWEELLDGKSSPVPDEWADAEMCD